MQLLVVVDAAGLREMLEWIDWRISELERELQALRQLRELINTSLAAKSGGERTLDDLPWRPFRDGGGEWIFEDEAGQELLEALRKSGGRVAIGGYVYILAEGKDRWFIRRKPIPQKQG
ncbi:MAG: hypothetical protein QXM16_01525 [Nitrososphaerota archaeon]